MTDQMQKQVRPIFSSAAEALEYALRLDGALALSMRESVVCTIEMSPAEARNMVSVLRRGNAGTAPTLHQAEPKVSRLQGWLALVNAFAAGVLLGGGLVAQVLL